MVRKKDLRLRGGGLRSFFENIFMKLSDPEVHWQKNRLAA